MKIAWKKGENPYGVIKELVLKEYGNWTEPIVVWLKQKYECEQNYQEVTDMLSLSDNGWFSEWLFENDWWEGQQDVDLIGFAPVSEIPMDEKFRMKEGVE